MFRKQFLCLAVALLFGEGLALADSRLQVLLPGDPAAIEGERRSRDAGL